MSTAKVRLIRKLANQLNGIDLTRVRVGEQFDVSQYEANMLIAEGWAVQTDAADVANDRPARPRRRTTE